MKVYNLRCQHAHPFEGWFSSEKDFDNQSASGLLACPVCGDNQITRTPSAPRVQTSRSASSRSALPENDLQAALAEAWRKVARAIVENTEDVGRSFAEEARRIHYREAPDRAIRGVATAEERSALVEEGIDVLAVPMLPATNGTLQ